MKAFDDVLAANLLFERQFHDDGQPGTAARGLAVVTCMDSRIEPLRMLGLGLGDAKILRNAGARVTEDVLRTLVLATHLLGVDRIMVVPHTDCRMTKASEEQIHALIAADSGIDTRSLEFRAIADQASVLAADVQKIRSSPFLPPRVQVGGFLYDVATGALQQVVT